MGKIFRKVRVKVTKIDLKGTRARKSSLIAGESKTAEEKRIRGDRGIRQIGGLADPSPSCARERPSTLPSSVPASAQTS